jgi:heme-degrading monooxygenase HmoA
MTKYSRIALFEFQPGTVDDCIRGAEQDLVPQLRSMPGFISYTIYRTGADEACSLTEWETHEAAEEGTRVTKEYVDENVAEHVVSARVLIGESAFVYEAKAAYGAEAAAP